MGTHSSKHKHHHTATHSRASPDPVGASYQTDNANSTLSKHRSLSKLAVIAVLFNPIGYKTRYDHYQRFSEHMAASGVYLVTVECIFQSAPQFGLPVQSFYVTRNGNPHHIQIIAPSIIWIKENLINIAVKRLPSDIEYIAWIDADIEFDRLDWPQLAIAALERYPIVQLFKLSLFLGPAGKQQILRRDYSFAFSIRENKPIDPKRYDVWYPHPGYAWAMRRRLFESIGGLIDFCIIGSADLHFAFALLNRIEETIPAQLSQDYRNLATIWGNKVAQAAQNGANVGYLPLNIYHYWHGDRSDRSYVDRWSILVNHQYSPSTDLEKNDDSGLIRFRADGRLRKLEKAIIDYFRSRNEDKKATNVAPRPVPPNIKKPFVAPKSQIRHVDVRHNIKPPHMPTRTTGRPHIWTSGPSGTHVDDSSLYCYHCGCHDHDSNMCPCPPQDTDHCGHPNYHDHEHCWENEHGHHDEDHHHGHHHEDHHYGHHHDDHHYGHHHEDHHHGHHGEGHEHGSAGFETTGYSGGGCETTGYSGGGFETTGYSGGGFESCGFGGAGSFY